MRRRLMQGDGMTQIQNGKNSRGILSFKSQQVGITSTWILSVVGIIAGLIIIGALVLINVLTTSPVNSSSSNEQIDISETTKYSTMTDVKVQHNSDIIISDGVIDAGRRQVPYYHCGEKGSSSNEGGFDLVLLHGMRFTKENWKESGILQKLCVVDKIKSIVALDLGNGADYSDLKGALSALQSENLISSNGGSTKHVVVTPSASGQTMVSWAEEVNELSSLNELIQYWIPVGSPAVLKAEGSVLERLNTLQILAVYGSRDPSPGLSSSEKLKEYANAQMQEIEGGHPCYLDSPDDFVAAVVKFLQI